MNVSLRTLTVESVLTHPALRVAAVATNPFVWLVAALAAVGLMLYVMYLYCRQELSDPERKTTTPPLPIPAPKAEDQTPTPLLIPRENKRAKRRPVAAKTAAPKVARTKPKTRKKTARKSRK